MSITPFEIDTNQKSKYHKTYKGALAFTLYRVQGWIKNGLIHADVNELKHKHRINYYDWDIIWLALKIIPHEVITHEHGIRRAREMAKAHPKISPYLKDWRKSRIATDKELKEIFHVDYVTPLSQIQEFIDEYKEWEPKEKKSILKPVHSPIEEPIVPRQVNHVEEEDSVPAFGPPLSDTTRDPLVFIVSYLNKRKAETNRLDDTKRTRWFYDWVK
jgi:hypothetical protein